MPQNTIQLQHCMSLSDFMEDFGAQERCEQALERARWPHGFACPARGGRAQCRTQSSVCSGTLFHTSKLPLTKWFQAIYLVTQNNNNISALSLKRHLRVAYATAWRVKHELLEAMRRRES